MSESIEEHEKRLSTEVRPPTVAELYALARLYICDVSVWRPKSSRRPALILLNDPSKSSVNPTVVTRLIHAGLVEAKDDTLLVTTAGRETLLEHPQVIVRMRAFGAN